MEFLGFLRQLEDCAALKTDFLYFFVARIGAPAEDSPEAQRRDEPRLVGEVRKACFWQVRFRSLPKETDLPKATHIIRIPYDFFSDSVNMFNSTFSKLIIPQRENTFSFRV